MRKITTLPLALAILVATGCSHLGHSENEATDAIVQPDSAPSASIEKRSVELTPTLLYRILIAELAHQEGDLEFAAHTYLAVAKETQDVRTARRATQLAIYAKQHPLAVEASQLWLAISPDDLDAHQSLAALLIRAGNTDQALPHLQRLIDNGSAENSLSLVSSMLSRSPESGQALSTMETLAKGASSRDRLYYHASLARQLGELAIARSDLDQLLDRHDADKHSLILYAQVLLSSGEKAAAIAILKRAVDTDPDDPKLRLSYARMLVDHNNLGEARTQFRQLMEQSPDNPDILYALGLLALQANDLEEAESVFNRLLSLEQRSDDAYFALGEIALAKQQPEQAIGWFESVSEGAAYLKARLRATLVIREQHGLDAARRYLETIDTGSEEELLRIKLVEAEMVNEAGQAEEAMDLYNAAVEQFPDSPDLLYARAMHAEQLNHLEMMESDIQRLLQLDPNNAQALNALGYTLADRTERYPEALDLLTRALTLRPDDPAILDSMGWVLYRMGRLVEAEQYLRQAAEKLRDGEVYAHLGEVVWAQGRESEARAIWEEAIQFAPDHPVLKKTLARHP